jgi:spectrin beta
MLDWAHKEQQYLFDAIEVESWMAEKRSVLASDDYGHDEDSAQKLLAKHRALQNDMAAYKKWIEKLATQCSALQKSDRPEKERFVVRQKELETEFVNLSALAEERRNHLDNAVCLYQYLR